MCEALRGTLDDWPSLSDDGFLEILKAQLNFISPFLPHVQLRQWLEDLFFSLAKRWDEMGIRSWLIGEYDIMPSKYCADHHPSAIVFVHPIFLSKIPRNWCQLTTAKGASVAKRRFLSLTHRNKSSMKLFDLHCHHGAVIITLEDSIKSYKVAQQELFSVSTMLGCAYASQQTKKSTTLLKCAGSQDNLEIVCCLGVAFWESSSLNSTLLTDHSSSFGWNMFVERRFVRTTSMCSSLPVSFLTTGHESRCINSNSYGEVRYSANHHIEPNPLLRGTEARAIKIFFYNPSPKKMTKITADIFLCIALIRHNQ